ncbi:GNAT family N-acetyltransferase [Spirosoma agri]|uniref:GNAT family N-acetyltransferase n=1 Tax=Spirosoma agri TaxID=1987381 RepID=A0A6M0IPF0_9BACT|nr:GNAT family N-acetyltransferase [Spirosoma agri]NEU69807.1 GNAT family N-acetyltransferase [Spirosoma agri]
MNESPVILRFAKSYLVDGTVPAEQYSIVEKESLEKVGAIRFRLSNKDDILLYAGHIGYNVDQAHRGKRYAAHACLALKAIALQNGFIELIITCDPDNWPSRRTCEYIGAELIDIIDLPPDNDMYRDGERRKCRYQWRIG